MANRYTTEKFVQGANGLAAALDAIADQATDVLAASVDAAAAPIEAAMRVGAPIRPDLPKNSKKLRPGEMGQSVQRKTIPWPESKKATSIIGPSGRAGNLAHLVVIGHLATNSRKGHTIRNRRAKAAANGTTYVPGNPFIARAVISTLPAQSAAFAATAANRLAEVARKAT